MGLDTHILSRNMSSRSVCLWQFSFQGVSGIDGWNVAIATIVANLIGGCIFFWVDRWIFGDKKMKKRAFRNTDELASVVTVIDDGEEGLN